MIDSLVRVPYGTPIQKWYISGHLGEQLSFLPCHSISTDNRLMKFPDKTLKFNFNHSPKAINSLITQSACVYLDLLPVHNNRFFILNEVTISVIVYPPFFLRVRCSRDDLLLLFGLFGFISS
jgi:hypothetical protein